MSLSALCLNLGVISGGLLPSFIIIVSMKPSISSNYLEVLEFVSLFSLFPSFFVVMKLLGLYRKAINPSAFHERLPINSTYT